MKRKEINEYAQSIVVRLYELGFIGSVQESVSTNSFYIHFIQSPDLIRLSDHGFNYERYNFLPRQKVVRTIKNNKYFYSMSYEGIDAFIEDFKDNNSISTEDIKKCNKNLTEALKTHVLRHIPTNTYYIENSNNFGKVMSILFSNSTKFDFMTNEAINFVRLNFRPNLVSAAIFKGVPLQAEIESIVGSNDECIYYEFVEVEEIGIENGTRKYKLKE